MLSKSPTDIDKLSGTEKDKEILRLAMVAELDATNLYEQLASKTEDEFIKKVLLDVAKEEKTHTGEFQTLLLERDKEQSQEIEAGKKEVQEIKEGTESGDSKK